MLRSRERPSPSAAAFNPRNLRIMSNPTCLRWALQCVLFMLFASLAACGGAEGGATQNLQNQLLLREANSIADANLGESALSPSDGLGEEKALARQLEVREPDSFSGSLLQSVGNDGMTSVSNVGAHDNGTDQAPLPESGGNHAASIAVKPASTPPQPTVNGTTAANRFLDGTGLKEELTGGCAPRLFDDFIDGSTWNNRRLLPRDCQRLQVNPPVFSWREPGTRDRGVPWTLTVRRMGASVPLATYSVDSPRLALYQALAVGGYEWTTSFVTKTGKTLMSQPRRFWISTNARQVEFPTGARFATMVGAKSRPRVLPTRTTFAKIASASKSNGLEPIHLRLIALADRALDTPIPASPDLGLSQSAVASYSEKLSRIELRYALDLEATFVEALGYAGRTTGDERYLRAGISRVLELASWLPDGDTSEANFDYANRAIYLALARALDWYSDSLTPTQTARIVRPLEKRLAQAINRFDQLDSNPFNSHVDVIVWSVLEALMYSTGTPGFDDARGWLSNTWDLLLTTANVWGANDGGFANGVGYAWHRMGHIGQTLAAIRVVSGVNFAQHGSIANLGDFLVAATAPQGTNRGAFGDAAEANSQFAAQAANEFRLYALLSGSPTHSWYWQMDTDPFKKGRNFSVWHMMLSGLALPEPTAAAPSNRTWAFDDAGITAIHSSSAATDRSSVFFRSSEFGSWVHSHADQNAFTFVSRGKDLLISGGYYPYFNSPHHSQVTRATRFKNALTFDGGIGQAEEATGAPGAPGAPIYSRDARGQLINHGETNTWAGSTGDARLAYRSFDSKSGTWTPLLSDALRTVAYNRTERVLLVYDYATSDTARRWELNFNALSGFKLDGGTVRVTNEGASACIDVYATTAGKFALSSGFPVAPENGAPSQYQARFVAGSRTGRLVAVTVIREDCRALVVDVRFGIDGQASASINGQAAVAFDRRTVALP